MKVLNISHGHPDRKFGGGEVGSYHLHRELKKREGIVSCFLAATALTDLMERNNAFAMMEPFLPRMLARSGINFTRVGKDVDYHGLRAPYFTTTQSAVDNMVFELRELYDAIHELVSKDFEPT